MEVDSRQPELNDTAIQEVEENKSFMHFVETYEQAYTYSEEHVESGKGLVRSIPICVYALKEEPMHALCTSPPNARSCMNHTHVYIRTQEIVTIE